MTKLDELTQKAMKAQAGSLTKGGHARAVLVVLAEVREMVPEELNEMPDDSPMPGRAFTAGYNGCCAEMLRRLDQTMEGK